MQTNLQSSKSRFKRSGSDLSVKTCSNRQLKIAVLNRQRRQFWAENGVLSVTLLISGSYFNSTWGVKTTPFRGVKIVELNLLQKWS